MLGSAFVWQRRDVEAYCIMTRWTARYNWASPWYPNYGRTL